MRSARRLELGGAVGLALVALLIILPDPATARTPKGLFGIDIASALNSQDFNLMDSGKVGSVRFLVPWLTVQPSPGPTYDWSRVDNMIGNLSTRGIRALPFVYGSPSWVDPDLSRLPVDSEHDRQAWRKLLRAMVLRYGPGGSFWANTGPYHVEFGASAPVHPVKTLQIWNEPNLGNGPRPGARSPAPQYARLVKISHQAIHGVSDRIRILLAGLPGLRAPKYLNHFYKVKGVKRAFDGVATHPYSSSLRHLRAQLSGMRHVMNKHGDRRTPLSITELGWGSAPGDGKFTRGLDGQKRILKRAFNLVLRNRRGWRIAGLNWYDWRDPPPGSHVGTCTYCPSAGLLNADGSPKPAWHAFQRFTGAA